MLLGGRVSAAEEPSPANYIRPGPVMPPGAGQLRLVGMRYFLSRLEICRRNKRIADWLHRVGSS